LKKNIPNKNNTIERIRIKLEKIKYYRGEIKNHLQYDRLKNDRDEIEKIILRANPIESKKKKKTRVKKER